MALEAADRLPEGVIVPDGVIRYVDRGLARSPRHDQGLGSK